MTYKSAFIAFVTLMMIMSCQKKEDNPARSSADFVGDWQETTVGYGYLTDSTGATTDTIIYQAMLSLKNDGTYQTTDERPFGIRTSGKWEYLSASEQLFFVSNSIPIPGFTVDSFYWDVQQLDGANLKIRHHQVLNPINGSPIEWTTYRDFIRK